MPKWPHERDVPTVFGMNRKVTRGVAGPDPAWERANLVTVKLPWRGVASWDRTLRITGLRVHKDTAGSLSDILALIWAMAGKSQRAIETMGMHLIGGGYNWRQKRRGSSLSMHSYGIAVDFDPDRNGMGDPTPAMDLRVVEIFEHHGWTWGGRWSPASRDGMHFQAAVI
jgi:D-alanyl-D-alanine carboxypeptidase